MSADRARLLALAKECEAAAGPERALDAWIAEALGLGYQVAWGHRRGLPPFTGSLDATLTLILPRIKDWNILLRKEWAYSVELCVPSHEVQGRGRTLALALCAAALRAIAEETSDD